MLWWYPDIIVDVCRLMHITLVESKTNYIGEAFWEEKPFFPKVDRWTTPTKCMLKQKKSAQMTLKLNHSTKPLESKKLIFILLVSAHNPNSLIKQNSFVEQQEEKCEGLWATMWPQSDFTRSGGSWPSKLPSFPQTHLSSKMSSPACWL